MFKGINTWLLKPYPLIQGSKNKLLLITSVGFFVFVFLVSFKPFDFDELEENGLRYAVVYGLITFLIMGFILFILPVISKSFFNPNTWVIYKMLLLFLGIILAISITNWYFTKTIVDPGRISKHSLVFFLSATTMVGFFPALLFIYITERLADKQHKSIANSLFEIQKTGLQKVLKDTKKTVILHLEGDNKNEIIKVDIEKLLYISSEKNYASIYYLDNGKVKERLIRTSLTKIATHLQNYNQIVRCHKSYIVNSVFVDKIEGNARSYLLVIPKLDFKIPVSRTFPKELLFTLVR